LPEIDGLRLAAALRRSLRDVRVVLLADVADEALRAEALEAGVDVVLANPGRISELEDQLMPAGLHV
jgi:DNA-binding response OmpR family regulator